MHTFSRHAALLALSLGTVASLPALAADELHYNQISLRAEASQDVARDLIIVTPYTEDQNTDTATLDPAVTTTQPKAPGQTNPAKDITLRHGATNTYPLNNNTSHKN